MISNVSRTISFTVALVLLMFLGGALYFSGTHIDYYADDFQWYFDPPPANIFHYFFHENSNIKNAYRPLQATFLIAVQRSFGLETMPIHVTQIFLHIILSWLVFVWMIRNGFGKWQAYIAALFMLTSQANVMAVLSNDTLSQVSGTLFGGICLLLLYYSFGQNQNQSSNISQPVYFLLSILSFAAALLSKETSISFLLMVLCIIWIKSAKGSSQLNRVYKLLFLFLPYLALTALYFYMRSFLGLHQPSFHAGRYGFHIGFNVILNFVLFVCEAFATISSVSIFVAFKTKEIALLLIVAMTVVTLLMAVTYGLWLSRSRKVLMIIVLFAVIGLFPTVLMNKVSELYLYSSMPFVSILVGSGIGKLIEQSANKSLKQFAFIFLFSLLLISHVKAVLNKTALMKKNGEQATILLDQIQPYLHQVPKGGQLVLLNPEFNQVEYSVFLMNGFNVFESGLNRFKQLSGRTDFVPEIVQKSQQKSERFSDDSLVLTFEKNIGEVHQLK